MDHLLQVHHLPGYPIAQQDRQNPYPCQAQRKQWGPRSQKHSPAQAHWNVGLQMCTTLTSLDWKWPLADCSLFPYRDVASRYKGLFVNMPFSIDVANTLEHGRRKMVLAWLCHSTYALIVWLWQKCQPLKLVISQQVCSNHYQCHSSLHYFTEKIFYCFAKCEAIQLASYCV